MNKVVLIGNIASDIESRTTQSGVAQCSFRLAVQRKFTSANGERETDFLQIVAWRKTAELCQKYLSKGRKVAVEGSIQTRSYDAQDGSKRYVTEIIADNVEFVESKSGNADNGNTAARSGNMQRSSGGFVEVDDEALPF